MLVNAQQAMKAKLRTVKIKQKICTVLFSLDWNPNSSPGVRNGGDVIKFGHQGQPEHTEFCGLASTHWGQLRVSRTGGTRVQWASGQRDEAWGEGAGGERR